jgi:predicted transcriptional regulator
MSKQLLAFQQGRYKLNNMINDVSHILLTQANTLKQALEKLDQSGLSVLLLIDKEGALQRTITDGDIRRLLLAGKTLDDNVSNLKNKSSIVADLSMSIEEVLALMDANQITQIPVVGKLNKPEGLYLRREIQPRIQLSIPHMGGLERQYVEDAFETNWLAPLGPNVDAFEEEMAEYIGSQHAAALSSVLLSLQAPTQFCIRAQCRSLLIRNQRLGICHQWH